MLEVLQDAMRRVNQPRSRTLDLRALRRRLRAVRDASNSEPALLDECREAAERLKDLRQRLSAALPRVSPCSSCASGCNTEEGAFAGGDCCQAATADVFSDEEVHALSLAGTRDHHLVAPRTEHRGCAFRGERGCSLPAEHRPSICVLYACRALRRHLVKSDQDGEIRGLVNELHAALEDFGTRRKSLT